MPPLNYSDPYDVFQRLGRLSCETKHRVTQIDRLNEEQAEADREYAQVSAVARLYLKQTNDQMVMCGSHSAHLMGPYSDWQATLDSGDEVVCHETGFCPFGLTALEPEDIAEALATADIDASYPEITEGRRKLQQRILDAIAPPRAATVTPNGSIHYTSDRDRATNGQSFHLPTSPRLLVEDIEPEGTEECDE
jgi:hypothetical protein